MSATYEMIFWLFVLVALLAGYVGYQAWQIRELDRQLKRLRGAENARLRRDYGRESDANARVLGSGAQSGAAFKISGDDSGVSGVNNTFVALRSEADTNARGSGRVS